MSTLPDPENACDDKNCEESNLNKSPKIKVDAMKH